MDDGVTEGMARGFATTLVWESGCKDCQAERRAAREGRTPSKSTKFEYSGSWAARKLDRGQSRSDRCERHRQEHARVIQALAVPYVDLKVIGEVADPKNPTGPLGGLGPLPVRHQARSEKVALEKFEFGMSDADILKLLDGLSQKRVAIVEAGTGTGKSTFMPFRLMNPPPGASLHLTKFGRIVVTEPRRAAAIGVARYVGEELCFGCDSRTCTRHVGPGFPVGYQVRGEKCWDNACELIYATDGTVINWVRDGELARIGTVIVDEAHERSENIDIILTQLREQIRRHQHLRVVITSATLDEAFFASFFGRENVFTLSVPPKKSFGYGVPLFVGAQIDDRTIQSGLTIDTTPQPISFQGWLPEGPLGMDGKPEDLQETTRALEKLRCATEISIAEWRKREGMPTAVVNQVVAIAKGTEFGDILAFLPTNAVIDWAVEEIKAQLDGSAFDVYPLLATTPRGISDKALAPRKPGQRRKIVVSSNLAETSLTVKGVRYVVDSGLICSEEWDPNIASGSLPTKPHSQAALRQRWGRVGRDAPGWVFPLYTIDQFLSLPRNTSPESTRSNLEEFYMKLAAAGADLAEAVVPGDFVPEQSAVDDDALRHVKTFQAESQRARRVLKLTGVLDGDGDLTTFGRELERYPGAGTHALALMLADQLACVHEVALALEVVGAGRLVGPRDDCVLRWDREWPTAWRVRAAQAHRGLAVGCKDDLDVVLRIFFLWQSTAAKRRRSWCQKWSINEGALNSIWSAVMETVDSLSAAMKQDASRPIELGLAVRARAILSHSMISARYRRTEGYRFRAEEGNSDEEAIFGYGRLMEVPDRILAFRRFRVESGGDEVRVPFISHFVAMLDWAEIDDSNPDGLAFELIRRIAEHAPASSEGGKDALSLLEALPIGAVIENVPGEELGKSAQVAVIRGPFVIPDSRTHESIEEEDGRSGFDREWSPYATVVVEIPEEEIALRILKAEGEEENDEPDKQSTSDQVAAQELDTSIFERIEFMEHFANTGSESADAPRTFADSAHGKRGIVVGYKSRDGGRWAALVDPISDDQSSSDPLDQPPSKPGHELKCIVAGTVQDHEGDVVQFNRADGLGRFYVSPRRNPGLDVFDYGFLGRLTAGASILAHLIPEGESGLTLTLLPAARKHLKSAKVEIRNVNGQPADLYPASVVEPANEFGKVIAELDHRDSSSGMSHRFGLWSQQVARAAGSTDVGTKVMLTLQSERTARRVQLHLRSAKEVEFAKKQAKYLELKESAVVPKSEDLPLSLILGLVTAGIAAADAWSFYRRSLHLGVKAVFSARPTDSIPISARLVALFFQRKREFEQRWGIEISIRRRERFVDIAADDREKVAAAASVFRELAQKPRLSAKMTEGAGAWLFGQGQLNRRQLEARSGISFVWVDRDDDVATIAGNSEAIVEQAMRELLKPARGVLTLPMGKSGALIGKGGATIKSLRASTECTADKSEMGDIWTIRGPSKGAVESFMRLAAVRLAAERVYGATGVVSDVGRIDFIADPSPAIAPTSPAREESTSKPKRPRRAAPQAPATVVESIVNAPRQSVIAPSRPEERSLRAHPPAKQTATVVRKEADPPSLVQRFFSFLRGKR